MAIKQKLTTADDALVAALQAGDAVAWELFLDRYGTKLQAYLRHVLPTETGVADVLSDTMLAAVQSIHQFSHEVSLQTWFYSLAYRKVIDFWRRQQRFPATLDTPGFTNMAFREVMAELPELAQHVFLLRYYVGLSVEEISEILGRSYKATESLLKRIRQQFHDANDSTSALISPNESVRGSEQLEAKPIFGAVYPMILLQKQLCQQQGMTAETAIFEQAQRQIDQLATIAPTDFLAELQFIENSVMTEDPARLIRVWLERHPTSEQ